MDKKEKTLKENLIYDGKIIKLYNDDVICPNGLKATREYIKHPGGACVLPIFNDEVLLISQYRYAYHKDILEVPAGKIEPNEDPLKAAIRELEEETGYKAKSLIPLGEIYPTVGYTDEVIYLFASENLAVGHTHLDKDEFIDLKRVKLSDAYDMALKGTIKDAKTVAVILRYVLSKKIKK